MIKSDIERFEKNKLNFVLDRLLLTTAKQNTHIANDRKETKYPHKNQEAGNGGSAIPGDCKMAEIHNDLLKKCDFKSCTFTILRKLIQHDAEQWPGR